MEFAVARPDIVRAVNQSWLLNMWRRLRGFSALPRWELIEKENLSAVSDQLSYLHVVGVNRFQVQYHGAVLGQVYGSPDCRGRFLDEILPATHRAAGLAPYQHVIESKLPVYTIHDVRDRRGRVVHYERLLLPFGEDSRNVSRILASFEFICPDGTFVREELMKAPLFAPTLRLCATIQPAAV
ncbi:MAG TPA: PAS domain-containing protein [Pseudolabrys sp.]|nr:PAS domain-containing protein [Pseudolabrys sp.]